MYNCTNKVVIAIVKMFFMVVLALRTKRFVLGITISAFFFIFMDYLAKIFAKC